jgi:hypothetical protein
VCHSRLEFPQLAGIELAVPENQSGRRLIKLSFTEKELEYLHQQPQFNKGFEKMQTLTDFERLVYLGNRLLVERGSEQGRQGAIEPE